MTSNPRNRFQEGVAYARTSRDNGSGCEDALANQLDRGFDYARHSRIRIIGTYCDTTSGSSINRPGLQRMLGFLAERSPAVVAVIVASEDRLARAADVYSELENKVIDLGGAVTSLDIANPSKADER